MEEYFIEEKSTYDVILDLLVFLAVFVVTIFLLLEIFSTTGKTDIDTFALNTIYMIYINVAVFAIFILDLIRLWNKSINFKDFIKHDWLDILATIPFELIAFAFAVNPTTAAALGLLKLSRIGRFSKAARIAKISKEFKAASHFKKESEEYKRKHRI
jgi:ABC-type branched-subunit amino acid transport system permease subunit